MPHVSLFEWAEYSWPKLETYLRKALGANNSPRDSVDQLIFKMKPRLRDLMAKSPRAELRQVVDLINVVRFELKLNSVVRAFPEATASLDQLRGDAAVALQEGHRDLPPPRGAPLDLDGWSWPPLKVVFVSRSPHVDAA